MALDSRLIALSAMALFGLVACSPRPPAQTPPPVVVASPPTPVAVASPLTLVKDGQPASVIVIAQDAPAAAKAGAEELQYHVKKMSGVDLQVVTADETPTEADTALILIGRSAATDKLGVDLSKVPAEGYIIKTVGNALVLAGDDAGGEGKSAADIMEGNVRGGSLFAVYGLLQDHLGVRWIWPGPTGESIPKRATVEVGALDIQDAPALERRHMRLAMDNETADADRLLDHSAKDQMVAQERQWYKRVRMGRHAEGPSGHSFRNHWERYGEKSPEIFALLPSGKRGFVGRAMRIKMCVANPKLWDVLEAEFKAAHEANPNFHALQACEADGRDGHCTCELCKAWDATLTSVPQDVLEALPADLYEDLKPQKDGIPGTVSTRYAKFLNEMCRRVRAIDPEGYVTMYAMTRLRETPIGVKMEPNLMVNYVGFNNYPLTPSERAAERRDFTGWIVPGTKVVLRPNAPHYAGDGMPYPIAREMADDFIFAMQHGMVQAEFDSMLGYWASWGPTHYVLTRLMWEGPDADPEAVISEWLSGFGPAQRDMRAYYDFWEEYIRSVFNRPDIGALVAKIEKDFGATPRGARLLSFSDVYPPEILAQARGLLETARQAAANADDSVKEKIANIELNQKNAELTARVAALARDAKADPAKKADLQAGLRELMAHRNAIATRNAVNVYWMTQYEIQNGDPFGWKALPEYTAAK